MISNFPSYLVLTGDSYSTTFDQGILRSEMENGPPKTRANKCRTMKVYTQSYHLCTIDDKLNFESWWKNDIKMGALWFLWYDLESKEEKRARIRGVPSFQLDKSDLEKWTVNLQIEVWF